MTTETRAPTLKVGDRIKLYRTARKLTEAQLAEQADITRGYLHLLEENARPHPGAHVLYRIARALSIPMETLLGEPRIGAEPVQPEQYWLACLRHGDKRPETHEDWAALYATIRGLK